jgi:nucleotide-binding universal stress UspA family protein
MATTEQKNIIEPGIWRGSPVYLVVADKTEEFAVALHYAARSAQANGAKLAVLYVMDQEDFQHWGDIEKRIRLEQRKEGEKILWEAACSVYDLTNLRPSLYLEEGGRPETILEVIDQNTRITKLILAASAHSGKPGPLVSHFTGKGLIKLRVPLTIVPGDISPEKIDDLV